MSLSEGRRNVPVATELLFLSVWLLLLLSHSSSLCSCSLHLTSSFFPLTYTVTGTSLFPCTLGSSSHSCSHIYSKEYRPPLDSGRVYRRIIMCKKKKRLKSCKYVRSMRMKPNRIHKMYDNHTEILQNKISIKEKHHKCQLFTQNWKLLSHAHLSR